MNTGTNRLRFTISQYAGILLAFSLLLVALLGVYTVIRVQDIRGLAIESRLQGAAQELQRALAAAHTETIYLAHRIANHNETRAQLRDPRFYKFWRTEQLLRPLWLPTYVDTIEIYNESGLPLLGADDLLLPEQIDGASEYLAIDERGPHLAVILPVAAERFEGEAPPGGFVGIRLDLLSTLSTLTTFEYLDPDTLRIVPPATQRSPIKDIDRYAAYELRPAPATERMARTVTAGMVEILFGSVLLALLVVAAVQALIGKPLRALEAHLQTAGRDDDGPLPALPGPPRVRELETLQNALLEYQQRLSGLHQDLDEKNDELRQLAYLDPLTGCHNRRAFEEDWLRIQAVIVDQRTEVACLVFDCDHFKSINDSYGHQVGDLTIRGIALALAAALREGDHLYRLGGDEFVTTLVQVTAAEAAAIGQRCLEAVSAHPFAELGITEPVRISSGMAHTSGKNPSALAELRDRADVAMYQAKRPGSGKLVTWSPGMENELLTANHHVSAVYRALEGEPLIELHYQPVYCARTAATVGYEALLRLRDDKGLIMPADILPLVRNRRLESELDRLVINRLLADLEAQLLPPGAEVSVNLSGALLMHPDVISILAPLRQHMVRHAVILEITETTLITRLDQVAEKLGRLREQGFRVALDDFGSGYSSLGYLGRMPVDIVKFDRSIVGELGASGGPGNIARGLARLVAEAGYLLVAEGIESETLEIRAKQAGFDLLQGFQLGRPLAAAELASSADQSLGGCPRTD